MDTTLHRSLVALVLALGAVGCDGANQTKSDEASESAAAPAPAKLDEGDARITFSTPQSGGEKSMTLLANGDVLVGTDKVGDLVDGKLTVDDVLVGQLNEDGTFRLGGFDDAVFKVEANGEMGNIAYAEDGTMVGGLVDDTKGMTARIDGDPAARQKMTFLFMALTVARGPAISNKANPDNPVKPTAKTLAEADYPKGIIGSWKKIEGTVQTAGSEPIDVWPPGMEMILTYNADGTSTNESTVEGKAYKTASKYVVEGKIMRLVGEDQGLTITKLTADEMVLELDSGEAKTVDTYQRVK